ncbi:hypothetical protein AB4K20DRAFT_1915215 [Rhizopus microsporus]
MGSCTNQKCLEPCRLWNRDLAAALSFKEIMIIHRQALGRPSRFKRQTLKRSSLISNDNFQSKHFRSTSSDDGRTSV